MFYQVDELRQPEAKSDENGVGVIRDGAYEPVVIAQQVVIESFGVRVSLARRAQNAHH